MKKMSKNLGYLKWVKNPDYVPVMVSNPESNTYGKKSFCQVDRLNFFF